MTEDINFKTPRRVKSAGDKPALPTGREAERKTAAVGSKARPSECAAVKRPRPVAGAAAPPRPLRPGAGIKTAAPREGGSPPVAPVRRPHPVSDGSVRREKSLEGLGRLLKTKREIQGLTRRDVVVKIKIPLDQLEAIEEGRLSSLPPVFAKGFLRVYANELGLDAETLLDDYRQLTGGYKNEPTNREHLASRYVETSVGDGGGLGLGAKAAVIALALVVLICGLSLWLWPGLRYKLGSSIPYLNSLPGFTETSEVRGPLTTLPAGSASGETSLPTDSDNLDDNGFMGDPISRESATNDSISTPVAAPARAGGILTLASRMDKVWVEIKVDGEAPQFIWMKNGQQITLNARQQVTVTTGQANAISANWNGQEINSLSTNPAVQTVQVTFPEGG